MAKTIIFIDPTTGEARESIQPFETIEELMAAQAQVVSDAPAASLDITGAFLASLDGGAFDKTMEETLDGLSDSSFVSTLYAQVLRRDADADGSAFWLEQLRNGADREDVLTAFVTSGEAISISSPEQIALLGRHFEGIAAPGDMM
jgi:hypothetical protein